MTLRGVQFYQSIIVGLGGMATLVMPLPQAMTMVFPPESIQFFENKIRPLLADNCFECHDQKKHKGNLLLTSREAILKGGDSGPAITPDDPRKSLLIEAIKYTNADLQMPPKKKLGKQAVADLEQWIRFGAPWPSSRPTSTVVKQGHSFYITDEDRNYWAFRPIKRPDLAKSNGQAPIDQLILLKLESKGITANPIADRATLIRRAYFDLIGLPPSYEEVQSFVNDNSPDAWSKLIEHLLGLPQYGERWGRHWLDVVRFAQTNGYERDDEKPLVWKYRDYVIQAFNEDKPYNRFVLEQIAGDELPDVNNESLIATGFYRLGVWDDEPDDKRAAEFDGLDDMLKTISETFMGLTVGCARCHDHMFDPISQQDYYEMLSFLRNVRYYDKPKYEWDSATYSPLIRPKSVFEWQNKKDKPKDTKPPWDGREYALTVREHSAKPMDTHLLIRGNAGRPSKKVEPEFLKVLSKTKPAIAPSPNPFTTGRRLALAKWIASPEHPLTARVMANRIWQFHFGRGLVPTPNDFGKAGMPCPNQALLDWLGAEFIDGGWSIKHMHRVIMKSKAYRRTSWQNPDNQNNDPGNELVWRQNLRRLEAEAIRDTILKASNSLNTTMGGRGFYPEFSGEVIAGASKPGRGWGYSGDNEQARRSVYAFVKRTMMVPFLEVFDYSGTEGSIGSRAVTTVAPQALTLLNSDFVFRQAGLLARELRAVASAEDETAIINALFRQSLARDARPEEIAFGTDYLIRQTAEHETIRHQLVFAPDVPGSIEKGFRDRLPQEKFLITPDANWRAHAGKWGGGYEGIMNVVPGRGPFALMITASQTDFVLSGRLRLEQSVEHAGILLRATAKGTEDRGYEIHFDAKQNEVQIRRHDGGTQTLAKRELRQPYSWHDFKVQLAGSTLHLWLNDKDQPALTATDSKPIEGKGHAGIRVWGGTVRTDKLKLHLAKRTVLIDEINPAKSADGKFVVHPQLDLARRRALQDLCSVMFNLSEFVYVN
ncbi:MAG: DUF1549 domain-containing protein [Verrucomicrobiota bacterium]|nr:DUF1549 domain-containing protein [Verrucomicrobiota bacterium]